MDNNVSDFKPRVYIKGWGCLLLARISMKNGLEAASMILSASTCFPSSQTRVTLVRSLSSLKSRQDEVVFSLRSLHWLQSFSMASLNNYCLTFDVGRYRFFARTEKYMYLQPMLNWKRMWKDWSMCNVLFIEDPEWSRLQNLQQHKIWKCYPLSQFVGVTDT